MTRSSAFRPISPACPPLVRNAERPSPPPATSPRQSRTMSRAVPPQIPPPGAISRRQSYLMRHPMAKRLQRSRNLHRSRPPRLGWQRLRSWHLRQRQIPWRSRTLRRRQIRFRCRFFRERPPVSRSRRPYPGRCNRALLLLRSRRRRPPRFSRLRLRSFLSLPWPLRLIFDPRPRSRFRLRARSSSK